MALHRALSSNCLFLFVSSFLMHLVFYILAMAAASNSYISLPRFCARIDRGDTTTSSARLTKSLVATLLSPPFTCTTIEEGVILLRTSADSHNWRHRWSSSAGFKHCLSYCSRYLCWCRCYIYWGFCISIADCRDNRNIWTSRMKDFLCFFDKK